MPLTATWTGPKDLERIADLRLRCYGDGPADRAIILKKTQHDRSADGDVLILSDDTGDVATATSLPLTVNVRGTPLSCQGVAWVGTVRSHRRRRVDGRGLASRVMDALAEKAKERGHVVGMLAPFRVSFYESFGYGVVERQNTWTVPLGLLPDDDTAGFREYRDADFADALACRQRQFDQTHGDVATSADGLHCWHAVLADTGFRFVDRQGDRVTGQFTVATETIDGRAIAVVHKAFYESPAALRRILAMLGTLRDQYSAARITLSVDLPLNWWLRERQVPHRRVDHPAASCQTITRMQASINDVPAFVAALRPRAGTSGRLAIDIAGTVYQVEFADGRATAQPAAGPADVTMDAVTWPAVAFGDLSPEAASMLGRLTAARPESLTLLTDLVAGPLPYCHEYF